MAKPDDAWTKEDSFATTLVILFLDEFADTEAGEGEDPLACLHWSPITIAHEAEELLGSPMPPASFARLMAGITLVTTDRFYKDLNDFNLIVPVLAGGILDTTTADVPDPDEIAWAISEALMLSPPDEDEPFTAEIRKFIGAILDRDGILSPPDVLRVGIRKGPTLAQVLAEHADNPTMAGTIRLVEETKNREIIETVREGLQRLLSQVSGLRLSKGSASDLKGRVSKGIQGD